MEIKKIDPLAFENFDKYMLAMPIDSLEEADNFYSIEIDGKFYIIGEKQNNVALVENDNGFFNPYKVVLDDNGVIEFLHTEGNDYLFKREGVDTFVQQEDNLKGDVKSLSFVKRDEVDSFIEYRQYIDECCSVLFERYQTLYNSTNATSALRYTDYHLPTQLELREAHFFGIFAWDKKWFYYLTEDGKTYRRAYIVTNNNYHLSSICGYDGEELINLMVEAFGFKREIDSNLISFVYGQNEEYNKMRRLIDIYQKYKLGHK